MFALWYLAIKNNHWSITGVSVEHTALVWLHCGTHPELSFLTAILIHSGGLCVYLTLLYPSEWQTIIIPASITLGQGIGCQQKAFIPSYLGPIFSSQHYFCIKYWSPSQTHPQVSCDLPLFHSRYCQTLCPYHFLLFFHIMNAIILSPIKSNTS